MGWVLDHVAVLVPCGEMFPAKKTISHRTVFFHGDTGTGRSS